MVFDLLLPNIDASLATGGLIVGIGLLILLLGVFTGFNIIKRVGAGAMIVGVLYWFALSFIKDFFDLPYIEYVFAGIGILAVAFIIIFYDVLFPKKKRRKN